MKITLDEKTGMFIGQYKGVLVRCSSRQAAIKAMMVILEARLRELKEDLNWWNRTYGRG